MIKNTIMGICSQIMQIIWGKRQETLLDITGSSIGRKVVTRAAGIGAEERDSVGEGGHTESWEDGGWWLTSWNEGVELWHRFWPVEGMQGVIAGAVVNSALQKQQVLKHPLYYLNFHITVSRRKKKRFSQKMLFPLSMCAVLYFEPYSSATNWKGADVKPHTKRWDDQMQGDFQLTGIGAPGRLFRSCFSDWHIEMICLWHWPQVSGTPGSPYLLLLTHAFQSISSSLACFTAQSPFML